jgi:hypothetical protein
MTFSVRFLYFDQGTSTEFSAECAALPRPGDLIRPERGFPSVVDHVTHMSERQPSGSLLMTPHVVLRPLTEEDRDRLTWVLGDEDSETPQE